MSSDQSGLGRFMDPDESAGGIRDYLSGLYGDLVNRVQDIGLDLDWWGQSPYDAKPSGDIWGYQFVTAFSKGSLGDRYNFDPESGRNAVREGSKSPEVQIKTGIYVVGEPTDEIERHIRDVHNPRVVTLFDTREYAGYLTGFGFSEVETYVQRERVSAREANQKHGLGVPWFEVEAYDKEKNLQGYADGYYNPFSTETYTDSWDYGEDVPEQEVWRVRTELYESRNASGQWEVGPEKETGASQRARTEDIRGKDVYIGPYHIGTVTARGTVWLRREYNNGGPYADKATITSQSGIPPQALQKGAKLYKYRETSDSIYLSTTRPASGFNPVDADDVSPEQVGRKSGTREVTEILLDEDEPTQFVVETDSDEGRLLGLYDPAVVRDISEGRTLVGPR